MRLRGKNIIALVVLTVLILFAGVWVLLDTNERDTLNPGADIYLYGESHGFKQYYDAEYELWQNYYENEGMRDLFVELPYFTAQYLNVWMKSDDDTILEQIYTDFEGTAAHTVHYMNFLKKIKAELPETVFYGTDVGHQYETTGKRYLAYVCEQDGYDAEEIKRVKENIEQGETWQNSKADGEQDWSVREEYMVSNFFSAYERCESRKIMGIYGSYHIDQSDSTIMAGKLAEVYKNRINSYYLINELLYPESYKFGICLLGIAFLFVLYVPNIVCAFYLPKDIKEYSKKENKLLKALELVGQVGISVCVVIFTDFTPRIVYSDKGLQFPGNIFLLFIALLLMVLYILFWVNYFFSRRTMADLYYDFAGIPFAGATLPVLIALLLGSYGGNLIMIAFAIILGIGHIGITYVNWKKTRANEEHLV